MAAATTVIPACGARLVAMGRAWTERPGAALPVIFPGAAEQKAAYRFLSNPHVTMDHIIEPHQEALVERCRPRSVVLAVQDTTLLNYNGLTATTGLVDIGGGGSGSTGIAAHFGIASAKVAVHWVCSISMRISARRWRRRRRAKASRRPGRTRRIHPPAAVEKESKRWQEGIDKALELTAACPDTRVRDDLRP